MVCVSAKKKKWLIKWSLNKHEKERVVVDLIPYIESFLFLIKSKD